MKIKLIKPWISPKVTNRLAPLHAVFRKLRSVHEEYIVGEATKGGQLRDCPYWYTERSHTGLLAAAVWRSGGTALEEYSKLKARGSKGRCDLWINVKSARFECEAKHGWIELDKETSRATKSALWTLGRAEDDVKNLRDKNAGKGLALGFLNTKIKWDKRNEAATAIKACFNKLKKDGKCHALVWIGVSGECHSFREGGWLYNGLLLIIKVV